jgi:D-xylonolactonase
MTDNTPILETSTPELVVDLPSNTGEGPLWNAAEQAIYWVDIPAGHLYRHDPSSDTDHELLYQHDEPIGGFTFQSDGSILLFCGRGQILKWNGGEVTTVVDQIPAEREGRFNDVIAGPGGQVFCGTMPTGPDGRSRLYRLELDGSLTLLFDDLGLSNGLGFSLDERTMYHTDTGKRLIHRMDLQPATGEVSNREVIVETPAGHGGPDGMAVDAAGNIWSARWDGHALFHYTATGDLLGKVPFPVRKVSSIGFGGPDLETAYVTTAGGYDRGPIEGELAGSLFRVNLGVRGRPGFHSKVLLG